MAKASPRSIEALLAELADVRREPRSQRATEVVRKAVGSSQAYVVARAADVAREGGLTDVRRDLVAAFERFMTADDKGCAAKTTIARALDALDHRDDGVFLRGVRHVQREGSWGGSVDVAAELRGVCGLALVRLGHRDAPNELTRLLADPEPAARLSAARGLAGTGHDLASLPLRLKVLTGDPEPAVIAECLAGILNLTPRKGIEFLDELLDASDDTTRDLARTALGESRLPEAFELLKSKWENDLSPSSRRQLLPAIALHRSEQAVAFILTLIRNGGQMACLAVESLGVYRADANLVARVEQAVKEQGGAELLDVYENRFVRRRDPR